MTPLHWATIEGRLTACSFLLDHGNGINDQDGTGCTPFILAAQRNRWQLLAYFHLKGADIHAEDQYGCSYMYMYVYFLCSDGDNALHWAVYHGMSIIITY